MEQSQFDGVARFAAGQRSRRSLALALGATGTLRYLGVGLAGAKKKKPKKKPLCLNGQTIKAGGDKRKKLIKNGATPGECLAVCMPQCNGSTCGPDGCGGTCSCSGNTVCDQGTCTACKVICGSDSPATCGTRLAQALLAGGRVTVCPGQYLGAFNIDINNTTLIGAGSGSNPVVDTILVATAGQRPLGVPAGITTFVSGLRITGGNTPYAGGGVRGDPNSVLFMDQCAVVGNKSTLSGSGISSVGRLTLTRSIVTGNGKGQTRKGGGLDLANGPHLLENSIISDNECNYAGFEDGKKGGGLYCSGAIVDIRGTVFRDNYSEGEGGGIWSENSTVTLDSTSQVVDNEVRFPNGGGGIFRSSGNVILEGTTVAGNKPDQCAGADAFTC